jgi:hypothetical protein
MNSVDYHGGLLFALPRHNPTRASGLNLWSRINEATIGRGWLTDVAVMQDTAVGTYERAVDIRGSSAVDNVHRWPYRQQVGAAPSEAYAVVAVCIPKRKRHFWAHSWSSS